MDWASAIIAAIAGGIGGAGGAIIASLLVRMFGDRARGIARVVMIVGAIIGYRVLVNYVEPVIGEPVRAYFADDVRERVETAFRDEAFFAAYMDRYPDRMTPFMNEAMAAYEAGGVEGLRETTAQLAAELGARIVTEHGPHNSDEVLVDMLNATLLIGQESQSNPRQCYAFFYNEIAPQNVDMQLVENVSSFENYEIMENAMARMITEAGDEIYPVDNILTDRVSGEIVGQLFEEMDVEYVRFFQGDAPQSEIEYQIACDLMVRIVELYSEHEESTAIARMMFGSGG